MDDKMTSKQRVLAALELKEPDRVPVGSFATHVAGKLCGISIREFATDPRKMALSQRCLHEKAFFDLLFPFSHVGMYAEGWGSKVKFVDAEVSPPISEFAVKNAEAWKDLEPFEPEKVQGARVCIDALKILKEELGDKAFLLGVVFCPMTSATHVAPMADVLKQVRRKPELLRIGLEVITESLIRLSKAFIAAGADGIFFAITRATGEILTKDQYNEIARPWDEKVLREINVPVIMHCCGRDPHLDLIAEFPNIQGLNWWDRGTQWSLKDAKVQFGRSHCLVAGIDQTRSILMGTPDDVKSEAKDAIEQAGRDGGLILFSGCDLPIDAPLENVRAIAEAAKLYGTYPLGI